MRSFFALAAVACSIVLAPIAGCARDERAYSIPTVGALILQVPPGWREAPGEGRTDLPPTIAFVEQEGERFTFQVTPIPVDPAKRKQVLSRDGLLATVEGMAAKVASRAVEKHLVPEPMGGGREGFYFGATDRSPGPGEAPWLLQGAAACSQEVLCMFTLLADRARPPAQAAAIALVRSARIDGGGEARSLAFVAKDGDAFVIALPARRGLLRFPAKGFAVDIADDARPYYFFTNRTTGLGVSFNLEPARDCKTSESCRDRFSEKLRRLYPSRQDWGHDAVDGIYFSEATEPGTREVDLRQRNVNAHLVVNGVWVDVHLSKVRYEKADRRLFLDFLRSLRTVGAR